MPWKCNRVGALGLSILPSDPEDEDPLPDDLIFISYDHVLDQIRTDVVQYLARPALRLAQNVYYHLAQRDNTEPSIWFTDPNRGEFDGAIVPCDWIIVNGGLGTLDLANNFLYGDDDFLLLLRPSGLQVWCFNDSMRPSGCTHLTWGHLV